MNNVLLYKAAFAKPHFEEAKAEPHETKGLFDKITELVSQILNRLFGEGSSQKKFNPETHVSVIKKTNHPGIDFSKIDLPKVPDTLFDWQSPKVKDLGDLDPTSSQRLLPKLDEDSFGKSNSVSSENSIGSSESGSSAESLPQTLSKYEEGIEELRRELITSHEHEELIKSLIKSGVIDNPNKAAEAKKEELIGKILTIQENYFRESNMDETSIKDSLNLVKHGLNQLNLKDLERKLPQE